MKKIYDLNSNKFNPVSDGNSYIYLKYDLIRSFLQSNFREEIQKLLLKPIKKDAQIEFWTEEFGEYLEIENFSSDKQEELIKKYNALIYEINRKIDSLKAGSEVDDFSWGNILSKVFNLNQNLILSDGNNIVVVWGWDFNSKKKYELPFEAFQHLVFVDPSFETPNNLSDINDINNEDVDTSHTELQEELVSEPSSTGESDDENPTVSDDTGEAEIESITPAEENEKVKRPAVSPTSNSFINVLNSIERIGGRHKWILFILIILVLLLILKLCSNQPILNASEMNPEDLKDRYQEIMPPVQKQRKAPVNDDDIINDTESKRQIVGNLVNIALKNTSDNFQYLAIDLKNAFPSDDYEIVYFDSETNRLQLKFPINQRASIKNKIRSKLSNYDLLIWDEAIFSNSKTFNDPAVNDNQKFAPWSALNLPAAWDITTGDSSVIVAVIDNGFDLKHFELKSKFVKPYNVVTDSRVITFPNNQYGVHGTHVAGIVGAVGNNSKGIIGAAPKCKIMPIQTSDNNSKFLMSDVVDAILYAIKNNADVINMSLGLNFNEEITNLPQSEQMLLIWQFGKDEAEFWDELFQMAEENNVTIVTAAGNQNIIVGLDPMSRSPRSIKVAATMNTMQKADFSNYFYRVLNNGSCLCAPGNHIYSSVPNNSFLYEDGTSMASPLVAGVVALMKSVNKNISNKNIMKILYETGVKTGNNKMGPFINAQKAVISAKNL
jgi:hypothetical protein